MSTITPNRRGTRRGLRLVAVAAALTVGLVSGCSAEDPDVAARQSASADPSSSVAIPTQQQDDALRERLPADIREAGRLVSVNSGSFPPYEIIQTDGSASGASADLLTALGELWGVEIEHETVDGLSSVLTGISAGRFEMGFGPVGDFPERQESNDFVDYVQEFVVFAVPAGNPEGITDLDSTCGKRIAVQAGGSAEKVIKQQAETCSEEGQEELQVMSFKDQPQSILSVQSGRADAFFSSQAPLTYFVQQSGGELELAGTGQANGFDTLYQGAVVKKDSELAPVLQDSLEVLFENGTYEAIMIKWGLQDNMLEAPGINLATTTG
ncbi:transporter substrate-binding domain-containing protein [Auraticoccus sp. F435]|uniref:Transporter substrate-binding domain-containing protein n=1 Tax=Auraticoccus cholistanensis TaxID=2656650 RepID=A0A6A9USI1_9ACTN|nr:ABC transporter substrate-binding protein [Auraticoccus cholistanensis]MVA74642.1 transporter substrate-binding domain-containing protein [Auraticoccus cholistanensis]